MYVTNLKDSCPRCGQKIVTDFEVAEKICNQCSFVVSQKLENLGCEATGYLEECDKKSRTDMPTRSKG